MPNRWGRKKTRFFETSWGDCPLKETPIKNGYPLTLLNEKIAYRYKYLLINKYHNKKLDKTIESKEFKKKIITLPYINNFQEQFHRIFKNSNLQIIFTYDNATVYILVKLVDFYILEC